MHVVSATPTDPKRLRRVEADPAADECGGLLDGDPIAKGPVVPNLAALCNRLPGKYKRIPTYLEPLDKITRGGLQTNRIVAWGGAPGVTKTTLTLGIGREMAVRGVDTPKGTKPIVVAYAACDEPRDGLLSRLGQMYGISRASLEDEDTSVSAPAWAHVAQRLTELPNLLIFDPRTPGEPQTIDEIARLAFKQAAEQGGRLVLIIDSIQTAPFLTDLVYEGSDKTHAKIEARMKSLRYLALELDACVLAISELNRPSYKKGGKPDLSSFKQAGGIEYGADLAITMERIEDPHSFIVEATVHKNRMGDEAKFRLERNSRCLFEPIEMPLGDEKDQKFEARFRSEKALVAEAAERLLGLIAKSKAPITSRPALCKLLRPMRASVAEDAISLLLEEGRIRKTKKGYRPPYVDDDAQSELELPPAPELDKRTAVLDLIRDQPGIPRASMARRLRDRGVTMKNDALTLLLVELERSREVVNRPDAKGAFHFYLAGVPLPEEASA